jgi:hypothetical protein
VQKIWKPGEVPTRCFVLHIDNAAAQRFWTLIWTCISMGDRHIDLLL